MIKLIGLLIVAVGFALRFNTLAVVVLAAVVSGLVAGLAPVEILELLGKLFVDNRALTLPIVLMIPVVAVLERHGLQQHVANLIRRLRRASAGSVALTYQVLRGLSSMVGLNLGNHASMVRPLVSPMAEGAAEARAGKLTDDQRADVRAHAAAAENVGNFFSDDILVAIGALLLVKAFFDNAGVEVSLADIKRWSLPTALWVIALGYWRFRRLDARLKGKTSDAPRGKDRP